MKRFSTALVLAVLLLSGTAFAQQPGVQIPAPSFSIPSAPVAPSPVPGVVTGLGGLGTGSNAGLGMGTGLGGDIPSGINSPNNGLSTGLGMGHHMHGLR